MHPNWKALATVDFQRKTFVRSTEPFHTNGRTEATDELNDSHPVHSSDAKNFYESVLASASERKHKPEIDEASPPLPGPSNLIRVKQEFKEVAHLTRASISRAFRAAQNDDLETLQKILAENHSCERQLLTSRDSYDWTLMMVAACGGATRVVDFLLKQKDIDLQARDRTGKTALDLARKNGHSGIVKSIEDSKNRHRDVASITPHAGEEETNRDEHFTCDVCDDSFASLKSWKVHVTSMIHLLNRSRAEADAGNIRPHFMIPESSRGYQMMLNVGWDKKSGLGPEGKGKLYPVKTILKRDRAGLGQDCDSKPAAKITHFDANDVSAVADKRVERKSTLSRWQRNKIKNKEQAKEVNFRREFSTL